VWGHEETSSWCPGLVRGCPTSSGHTSPAPLPAHILSDTVRPMAEQGELALLGSAAHARAENRVHHVQLVLGSTSVACPAVAPRGRARAPQSECSLGFCSVLGAGVVTHVRLACPPCVSQRSEV
jgi:hypothetical protein